MLKGKKILIGITGSIAAYKIPPLIRLFRKEGAEVRLIVTEAARDFVTPLTLSALSGNPVYSGFFNPEDGHWHSHIELGSWADIYLIAPVSATTLGKLANGLADNLLVATYLAARCPVFFAPAMDVDMYNHPTTRANIDKLVSFGNILIEPGIGELASGLCGAGRLKEPHEIVQIIRAHFTGKQDFLGKKVLVTAGPTYEAIDPVRYIGNYSSGLMGYAIAGELASRGAMVSLVSGPVNISADQPGISLIKVVTASEMYDVCMKIAPGTDIIIMAAAVADFTPEKISGEKIHKSEKGIDIRLVPTHDILSELCSKRRKNQFIAGFALETSNELESAKQKLLRKKADLIILNSLKDEGAGFGTETNKVTFIDHYGITESFPVKKKTEVARDIADKILRMISSDSK